MWEEQFVCQWARHWRSGAPIPSEWLQRLKSGKTMFAALEMRQQLVLARLDQSYHRTRPSTLSAAAARQEGRQWDSTVVYREVHESCLPESMPWAEGTHWQTQFSHLVGYGGGYYSYLYSQMFASRIWHACFAGLYQQAEETEEKAGGGRCHHRRRGEQLLAIGERLRYHRRSINIETVLANILKCLGFTLRFLIFLSKEDFSKENDDSEIATDQKFGLHTSQSGCLILMPLGNVLDGAGIHCCLRVEAVRPRIYYSNYFGPSSQRLLQLLRGNYG